MALMQTGAAIAAAETKDLRMGVALCLIECPSVRVARASRPPPSRAKAWLWCTSPSYESTLRNLPGAFHVDGVRHTLLPSSHHVGAAVKRIPLSEVALTTFELGERRTEGHHDSLGGSLSGALKSSFAARSVMLR